MRRPDIKGTEIMLPSSVSFLPTTGVAAFVTRPPLSCGWCVGGHRGVALDSMSGVALEVAESDSGATGGVRLRTALP